MVDRAQPGAIDSIIRGDELRQVFGRFSEGFVVPGSDPTPAAQRRGDIDETTLDAFSLTTSATALDVTVAPGEGFVGGWFCRDRPTTLALPPDTTVDIVVGFSDQAIFDPNTDADRDDADEVIVALAQNTSDDLPTTVAHRVTTDGDGVISNQRIARVGSSIQVESVSTDVVTVGATDFTGSHTELNDIQSDNHHTKTTSASGLTDVSADSVSGAHHSKTTSASELSDVSADSNSNAHHSRYTDSEASSAAPVQSVNDSTGDVTVQVIPSDAIIMWSGSITNIPSGWTLCDGKNGAPDLRNRFIAGAGDEYNVGDTGGEEQHQLTTGEMPSHDHTTDANTGTAKRAEGGTPTGGLVGGKSDATINSTGADEAHENRPRFYSLAYIYKL